MYAAHLCSLSHTVVLCLVFLILSYGIFIQFLALLLLTIENSANIYNNFKILLSQDQETGTVRQEEKSLAAEKRKKCQGDSDVAVKPSHEAESSSKKTRLDDYFMKKTATTKASSITVKEDDDTGYIVLLLKFASSSEKAMLTVIVFTLFLFSQNHCIEKINQSFKT